MSRVPPGADLAPFCLKEQPAPSRCRRSAMAIASERLSNVAGLSARGSQNPQIDPLPERWAEFELENSVTLRHGRGEGVFNEGIEVHS